VTISAGQKWRFAAIPEPGISARCKQEFRMKILAGLVAGLILAILVSTVLAIAGATSPRAAVVTGAIVFLVKKIIAPAIAVSASSAGRAWRRLLVTSGIAASMLPSAGIVFTDSHIATNISIAHSGLKTAGGAIDGILVSKFRGGKKYWWQLSVV